MSGGAPHLRANDIDSVAGADLGGSAGRELRNMGNSSAGVAGRAARRQKVAIILALGAGACASPARASRPAVGLTRGRRASGWPLAAGQLASAAGVPLARAARKGRARNERPSESLPGQPDNSFIWRPRPLAGMFAASHSALVSLARSRRQDDRQRLAV